MTVILQTGNLKDQLIGSLCQTSDGFALRSLKFSVDTVVRYLYGLKETLLIIE